VAEGQQHEALFAAPGLHVKNLYLTDKKKQRRWLVSAPAGCLINLKSLGKALGASPPSTLRFAPDLHEVLGVLPGAATPFAVFNDKTNRVVSVLGSDLLSKAGDYGLIYAHPLHNEATIGVTSGGLRSFFEAIRRQPTIVDFSTLS
jgi:Ala-tRNA(Pro) deacylase